MSKAKIHDLVAVPAPVETDDKSARCDHRGATFTVHEWQRSCVCSICKKEVDPYWALMGIADNWALWKNRRIEAQTRYKEAESRLNEILHEEKKAKARLQRTRRAVKEEESMATLGLKPRRKSG